MSSQPVRPELATAWERYFAQKGGLSPDVPGQILPVVIMDDTSLGPYFGYRGWYGSHLQSANVGVFSYLGVLNTDDLAVKSAVVVDEIRFRNPSAGDDIVIMLVAQSLLAMTGLTPVDDASIEKEPTGFNQPKVGNVVTAHNAASAVALGAVQFPNQASPGANTQPGFAPGPWVISPGMMLLIRPTVVNETLLAYFRGRYYSTV